MRRIHLTLAALLVVAAVTLAACGSSSRSASSASGNFCDLVKHDKNDKTLNGNPTNLADAKKQVQAVKSAIDDLTGAAPSAIKSQMQTLQRLSNDLATATKNAKNESDFASKAQALQSESKSATAASQKVDTYSKQHCGTTLGSGG